MNVVYSNAIKSNFKEYSGTWRKTGEDPTLLVASREKLEAIQEIVTAIIGAYQSASEVRLYTMDGSCAAVGYHNRTVSVILDDLSWYQETLALNGYKYITVPEVHKELPAQAANRTTKKFISLTRTFQDGSGKPEGIVEVIQDCAQIFSLADQLNEQNPDSSVYIYNERRELVYPYSEETPVTDYQELIDSQQISEGSTQMLSVAPDRQQLVTYLTIPDYKWNVILAKDKSAVYRPIESFRIIFTVIVILSIIVTLCICYYISRRMTIPLRKLTAATGKITINRVLDENKVNLTSADSKILELSLLCEAIRNMYEKLRSTSQEVLLSRSEETRAKLQATQSLINPHFLYNCLTNIGIMAEEEMNEDITKMCHALCNYFRYISSSKEMIVTLKEEIFYTQQYLECMKLRFSEELEIFVAIEDSISDTYIPKLIIQPIVENAFKYAFQMNPPWILTITANQQDDFWIIRIRDNGGTLSEEKKQEMMHLYENLNMNEELKSMQIGGMGLKNVYLRMKLIYGEQAIFRIDTSEAQATIFELGGPIFKTKEDYYAKHPQI